MFHRFLRPVRPSFRRSYSLFSKPPGGRFFNSSKPPKVVPPASAKSPSRVEPSTANGESQQPSHPDDSSTSQSATSSQPSSPPPHPTLSSAPTALASHPPLSGPDLRLHQFFAQHRPLVLSQPTIALFDSSATLALGPTPPQAPGTPSALAAQATLEDPPETTPEADADTARLLSRALAMNAVNSVVSWDATLRRLGFNSAENTSHEGLVIDLDSTKRKRRKKMKKHKLKKRRRLQRAQRLKIGR
ncbi:hypothetical protein BC827DRAFT_1230211 [Russula dissimulans]|nr:hypothetical protein BC827DRAFT_1230211 [Russula dissimulans]